METKGGATDVKEGGATDVNEGGATGVEVGVAATEDAEGVATGWRGGIVGADGANEPVLLVSLSPSVTDLERNINFSSWLFFAFYYQIFCHKKENILSLKWRDNKFVNKQSFF